MTFYAEFSWGIPGPADTGIYSLDFTMDTIEILKQGTMKSSQNNDVYRECASIYDQTVGADLENNSKKLTSEQLLTLLSGRTDALILDVCAGTGLVGEELHNLGLCNLDAIDCSPEMLEVARQKKLYKRIICDFIGTNRLDIADNTYDGLICVGSFAAGHLKHDCLPEMIRITKPGGYIVLSFREAVLYNVKEYIDILEPAMQELHDNGQWKWLSRSVRPDYRKNTNGVISSFQVC